MKSLLSVPLFFMVLSIPARAQTQSDTKGTEKTREGMTSQGQMGQEMMGGMSMEQMSPMMQQMMPMMQMCQTMMKQMTMGQNLINQEILIMMKDMAKMQTKMLGGLKPGDKKQMMQPMEKPKQDEQKK